MPVNREAESSRPSRLSGGQGRPDASLSQSAAGCGVRMQKPDRVAASRAWRPRAVGVPRPGPGLQSHAVVLSRIGRRRSAGRMALHAGVGRQSISIRRPDALTRAGCRQQVAPARRGRRMNRNHDADARRLHGAGSISQRPQPVPHRPASRDAGRSSRSPGRQPVRTRSVDDINVGSEPVGQGDGSARPPDTQTFRDRVRDLRRAPRAGARRFGPRTAPNPSSLRRRRPGMSEHDVRGRPAPSAPRARRSAGVSVGRVTADVQHETRMTRRIARRSIDRH